MKSVTSKSMSHEGTASGTASPKVGYFRQNRSLAKPLSSATSKITPAMLSGFAKGRDIAAKPGKIVDSGKDGGEAVKQKQVITVQGTTKRVNA